MDQNSSILCKRKAKFQNLTFNISFLAGFGGQFWYGAIGYLGFFLSFKIGVSSP